MNVAIGITCLFVLLWLATKLAEPWNKYHLEIIVPLEKELAAAGEDRKEREIALAEIIEIVTLFARDFKSELHEFQNQKSDAYDDLKPLQEAKSELYSDMEDVQYSLNRWHKNSKSFWGNKTKKIKDDSILGWFGLEQTVAQKRSMEGSRSTLSSDISDMKEGMSSIYENRIRPAKEGMDRLFKDKKRLEDFRRQGYKVEHFRKKKERAERDLLETAANISRIQNETERAKREYRRKPE